MDALFGIASLDAKTKEGDVYSTSPNCYEGMEVDTHYVGRFLDSARVAFSSANGDDVFRMLFRENHQDESDTMN